MTRACSSVALVGRVDLCAPWQAHPRFPLVASVFEFFLFEPWSNRYFDIGLDGLSPEDLDHDALRE